MFLLHANNASAWTGPTGNNTYLLPGRVPALVDAGVGDTAHLDAVASALAGQSLARVLVTHGHPDHVGGLSAIAARWPSARAIRFADGADLVEAGDTSLRVVHTPGHAPDHLCFFDEDSGDLYCGDLIRAGGSIVIPASKGQPATVPESLVVARELSPRRLLPGHGPVIDDPFPVIDEYLRHRARREEEVVAGLRAGLMTPEQIATQVYGALPSPLAAAAADSVLAHLVKLHDEQRAFVSGWWRLS